MAERQQDFMQDAWNPIKNKIAGKPVFNAEQTFEVLRKRALRINTAAERLSEHKKVNIYHKPSGEFCANGVLIKDSKGE